MGSGASRDSSQETPVQGVSRSSPVPRSLITRRRSSSQPADPSQNETTAVKRRATINNETPVKMSSTEATTNKKTDKLATPTNDDEDDELIPSAKSSFESDDVAFETFCGEIDRVLEGHDSVVEAAAHGRKSSVCLSVVPGVQVRAPAERAPSDSPRATCQQPHVDRPAFQTQENKQDPHFYPQHLTHLEHRHQEAHGHFQQQQQQQQITTRPTPSILPLAAKSREKPISVWKRPEDLAHQEQALRDQYQDTWFPRRRRRTEDESTAYASGTSQSRGASEDGGSKMRKRQNLDHQPFWEERKETKWAEPPLQEKEDFDISKFKAANKNKNGHKVDRLLPATYRGYNASLSRQGTLPSLHRGSISSTVSSSGTPASDKQGSSSFDNSKELKYNPSEEALLDFIEKEFS